MSYPYYNNPIIPSVPTLQSTSMLYLLGRKVANENEIQPSEIPMTGDICYFPILDGSKIITKQWKTDGSIETKEYLLKGYNKNVTIEQLNDRLRKVEHKVFGNNRKPYYNKSSKEGVVQNEHNGSYNKNSEKQSEVQKQSDSSTLS